MRSTLTENEILKSLIDNKYLTEEDVSNYIAKYDRNTIIDNLLSNKLVTKDLLGQSIAESLGIPYFDLNSAELSTEAINILSQDVIVEYRALVVKVVDRKIFVVTDNVRNFEEISAKIKSLIPKIEIDFLYSLTEDIDEVLLRFKSPFQERADKIFSEGGLDFTNKFIYELFNEAIELRASDIHLEPQADKVIIKVRIDGLLLVLAEISQKVYENVLNRIKVLANIRIDQRFRTQDGAIRYTSEQIAVDLRVSIIPILDGQKIVIRILSNYTKDLNINDLGFSEENFMKLKKAYSKTFGMILTTGPTGSGKTTTLYSIIKTLQKPEINITTIEDPVEYRIPGINQIQVNTDNEITFAKGLRSMVRQDPNVMLVGEIRDVETAEIAVNAALTGHLLLSTFHANDAATAIPRLMDMGIEPFLLASTLNLIIAQRLARRICEACKYSQEYTHKELEKLIPNSRDYFKEEKIRMYKGKGCQKCNNTGYRGRVGIFEVIDVSEDLQNLILTRASSREIWKVASQEGAQTFFEDGLEKVKSGLTTIEEILRVAPPPTEKIILKNIKKLSKNE